MQEERREYMVWNETGLRIIGRPCACGDVARDSQPSSPSIRWRRLIHPPPPDGGRLFWYCLFILLTLPSCDTMEHVLAQRLVSYGRHWTAGGREA